MLTVIFLGMSLFYALAAAHPGMFRNPDEPMGGDMQRMTRERNQGRQRSLPDPRRPPGVASGP